MRSSGQQRPDQITQTTIRPLSKTKGQEAAAEEKQAGCYIHDIIDMRAHWGIRLQDREVIKDVFQSTSIAQMKNLGKN